MVDHEMDAGLWQDFLAAGHEGLEGRWSDHRIWREDLRTLGRVSDALWEGNSDVRFDYVCGIRGSGLPLATLMAVHHKIPLLWFRDSSIGALIPRYRQIENRRILLIDSYARTGLNLQRHVALLHYSGAVIERVAVAFHMDIEPEGRNFDDVLMNRYGCETVVTWRWSQLRDAAESGSKIIKEIYLADSTRRGAYWP